MTALRTIQWARALLAALIAAAALPVGAASVVNRHGDWTVYTHDGGADGRICFATVTPKPDAAAAQPARGQVVVFISAWPKDGVKAEFSVLLGAAMRAAGPAAAIVDKARFPLSLRGDRAFVDDALAELKLIEAMRKGTSLVVEAVSETGTATRDEFSINGLGPALQALRTSCG